MRTSVATEINPKIVANNPIGQRATGGESIPRGAIEACDGAVVAMVSVKVAIAVGNISNEGAMEHVALLGAPAQSSDTRPTKPFKEES